MCTCINEVQITFLSVFYFGSPLGVVDGRLAGRLALLFDIIELKALDARTIPSMGPPSQINWILLLALNEDPGELTIDLCTFLLF